MTSILHLITVADQLLLGMLLSSPSFHNRNNNHLPRLAEATAGPEDIILVLVAAPVGVGGGSAASAVLGEGGGGINVTGEEEKGGPKDAATLLPRIRLLVLSALFSEDPCDASRNLLLIAFRIYREPPGEKVILPFVG